MKFTQNEAAKKISAILTRGGKKCYLSERTINEQLDTLMKLLVNDETELDDFIAQVEPMFKTSNGNAQKDQADFVTQWNTDHPDVKPNLKDGEGNGDGNGDGGKSGSGAQEHPEFEALRKQVEALTARLTAQDKEKTLLQKKNELIAKLTEKGVKDKDWIDSFVGEISISDDFDVEAKADTYLKLYNKGVAGGGAGGGTTPKTPGGGNNEETDTLKLASEMAKRNREAAEQRFK
jgi:hypothetical protein